VLALWANKTVRRWLELAQKRAGVEVTGAIHRLRHSLKGGGAGNGTSIFAFRNNEPRRDFGQSSIDSIRKADCRPIPANPAQFRA